jgi:hypothetical protein
MKDLVITTEQVAQAMATNQDRKATWSDNFWLKHFTVMHKYIA